MTRLALVLAAAALLLPGAASAAACSPLNCAPSQFTLKNGTLIAYRHSALGTIAVDDLQTGKRLFTLPGGYVYGRTLVHLARDARTIEWYDVTTGKKTASTTLRSTVRLAGASQDGSRAVAFDGGTVVVATPDSARRVTLAGGRWDFDALRGDHLVLIKWLLGGGYQVRLLDLAGDTAATRVLKDPHESGVIWGQPFSRVSSPDGRYLFTLYVAGNGAAMVHELDLASATARCIDLPGSGDYGAASSWALLPSRDGRTLWAASPGYGHLVALDVARRAVRSRLALDLPYWNLGNGTRAALSPDGASLALADNETVAVVDLTSGRLVSRTHGRATALGWSRDGRLRRFR